MPQAFVIYNLNTVAIFFVVAWLLNECNCFLLCIYTCMYDLHVSMIRNKTVY